MSDHPTRKHPQTDQPYSITLAYAGTVGRYVRVDGMPAGEQRPVAIGYAEVMREVPYLPTEAFNKRGKATKKLIENRITTIQPTLEKYREGIGLSRDKQAELKTAKWAVKNSIVFRDEAELVKALKSNGWVGKKLD